MVIRVKSMIMSITLTAILLASGCIENGAGKIAFVSERDGNKEIYVVKADGSDIARLTNNSYDDVYPVLSPDGKKIAFISYRGTHGIFLVNTDGSGEFKLTDNLTDYQNLEWAPDGKKIVLVGRQEKNYDIYTINVDGSDLRRLTDYPKPDWAPKWSPDGTKIAFTRGPWLTDTMPAGPTEIYIMDNDGSNQMPIKTYSNRIGYAECPDWSPDGKRIVYTASIDGIMQICVMNADGSDQVILEGYKEMGILSRYPEWSPNGDKIAYMQIDSSSGGREVVVMDADGSDRRVLSNCPGYWQDYSWSPDGDRIAFVSELGRNYDIYVENTDGSNKFALASSSARDYMISWSK